VGRDAFCSVSRHAPLDLTFKPEAGDISGIAVALVLPHILLIIGPVAHVHDFVLHPAVVAKFFLADTFDRVLAFCAVVNGPSLTIRVEREVRRRLSRNRKQVAS
jgi:hypothetical protein